MITLEKKGPIAILTLNRPDAMNALGEPGDGEAVRDVCDQINRDKNIRCAILTGAGARASRRVAMSRRCASASATAGSPAEVRDNYKTGVHMIVRALYNLEVPLIAAVNGAAVGLGCDVACMADIRISSDNARYGVTFLKIGLIPGDGGAWLLPRVIGMSRACELLFTGSLDRRRHREGVGPRLENRAGRQADGRGDGPRHADRETTAALAPRRKTTPPPRHAGDL